MFFYLRFQYGLFSIASCFTFDISSMLLCLIAFSFLIVLQTIPIKEIKVRFPLLLVIAFKRKKKVTTILVGRAIQKDHETNLYKYGNFCPHN